MIQYHYILFINLMSDLNIFAFIKHSQNPQAKAKALTCLNQIPTLVDDSNATVLHVAAYYNNFEMAQFFFAEYQKLIIQNPRKFNQQAKIKWLAVKDNDGFTCLQYSVFRGNYKMMKILEQNGADIYQINNEGLTVLHIAAQGDSPLLLYYFLTRGFKIDSIDYKGNSPLHWACYSRSQNAAFALISWGAEIQKKQQSGMTPLHLAVISKNSKIVKKLLLSGSDRNIPDFQGKLPIDIAEQNQLNNIVNMIVDKQGVKEFCHFKTPVKKIPKYSFSLFLLLFLYLSSYILNILSFGLCYDEIKYKQPYITFFVLGFLQGFILIRVITSNPGILKNYKDRHRGMFQLLLKNKPNSICFDCTIVKPQRSKHCQICESCISVYDHHCPWIGNCIGSFNYFYFYVFLLMTIVLITFTFGFCIANLVDQNWKFLKQISILRVFTSVYCLLICFIFIIPILILILVQTRNTFENTTTYERHKQGTELTKRQSISSRSRSKNTSKLTQLSENLKFDQVEHPTASMSVARGTSLQSLGRYTSTKYKNCINMCWKNKKILKYKMVL